MNDEIKKGRTPEPPFQLNRNGGRPAVKEKPLATEAARGSVSADHGVGGALVPRPAIWLEADLASSWCCGRQEGPVPRHGGPGGLVRPRRRGRLAACRASRAQTA
jgi:hypothetical protein